VTPIGPRKPRAAYTPQLPRLFSDSLRDNLLMGLRDDTALDEAVYAAVFEDDLKEMPGGLLTVVGARGMRLSGGQIQRMAAARMFARRPELIVVDDLSSALDVDTEQALWDRFFARQDQTCIVVTHRPHVLARANQVIRLEDGRMV
jgi:ATP-binding cassette subfamily B protein